MWATTHIRAETRRVEIPAQLPLYILHISRIAIWLCLLSTFHQVLIVTLQASYRAERETSAHRTNPTTHNHPGRAKFHTNRERSAGRESARKERQWSTNPPKTNQIKRKHQKANQRDQACQSQSTIRPSSSSQLTTLSYPSLPISLVSRLAIAPTCINHACDENFYFFFFLLPAQFFTPA